MREGNSGKAIIKNKGIEEKVAHYIGVVFHLAMFWGGAVTGRNQGMIMRDVLSNEMVNVILRARNFTRRRSCRQCHENAAVGRK